MRLERLTLTDFRNYSRCVWKPAAALAVFTGENGSGKTNLLEAVSLLAPGRGLRSAPPSHLLRNGSTRWGVASHLLTRTGPLALATGSAPQGQGKRIFQLDGTTVRSQAQVAGSFDCVWLTPQMERLFGETASGRRRFLDRLVMGVIPDHARQMAAHERSVYSRNRLLTNGPTVADSAHLAWLEAVEHSISRHAVAATAARMAFVERMNRSSFTTPEFPRSLLQLECRIAERLAASPALEVEDWLRGQLHASRPQDRERGTTGYGAHRSDFSLRDALSGREAALSSSGQQKIMLVGLILAHAQLVAEARNDPPVILLDEPLVHLDERHRHALLDTLQALDTTTLLTGTEAAEFSFLQGTAEFNRIRQGQLLPA
ncbi:DNA replication/repair protein RecF [Oecophyllibacter saccharovorans]|uniref:DNA replication/repair protein RecF n=1 Tax=Oecophyllibacter saccharovorans TaxID=2558360 RepID=UPI001144E633|nr:DNA replication/repair protein RecF [Oecophyllibacter saccharovorans]QDH14515.1 DNA replication/repair protein RecF [Oecophyllibacter saccharovorans]